MYLKLKITITSIAVILFVLFSINYSFNENKEICIEDKFCYSVEIAESVEEQTIGLSNHLTLDQDEGMLFIYNSNVTPGFWMKNMKFPIDIIWVNSNNEIIGFEKSIQPCLKDSCEIFYPEGQIMYVLEVNSNHSEKYNFSIGDRVFIEDKI